MKSLSQEKIDLPKKAIFTTLGRLDSNKNQILLLKAAKLVKKYKNDFEIYLLGDGEERKKVDSCILTKHWNLVACLSLTNSFLEKVFN